MTPSQALGEMRRQAPLVHCITNYVAMNIAANTMLAAGASPAMIHAEVESADFARIARALTVNIGTLSPPWVAGMHAAIGSANAAGTPWVFDPVAHFATPYRARVAQELLALRPTIIRGNASEILSLGGSTSTAKGVDAHDTVAAAEAAAQALALQYGSVVAVTGPADYITDGQRSARVTGGSALMPQVTALGCSLTCLVGAFAAVAPPLDAAAAALCLFAEAGERAGKLADGPGSFGWRFLDALAAVEPNDLDTKGRISWH